uniref:Uncharacterized protein n=1 Tax=Oryza nivara TaxID=4536 RepID=A0A0E0IRA8_ORYNI
MWRWRARPVTSPTAWTGRARRVRCGATWSEQSSWVVGWWPRRVRQGVARSMASVRCGAVRGKRLCPVLI